jgi:hypothetical protein
LRFVLSRGIIRDGLAATRTINRQFSAWHSGEMDRRRSCDLRAEELIAEFEADKAALHNERKPSP